jgi:hypothetical protein
MAVLNHVTPIRALSLFAIAVFCSTLALAQEDWHLSAHGSKALFVKSAFAHGYMHGYEEGFHCGDLDLQMGRSFREVKNQEHFKKPSGYRSEFGDRGSFDQGYKKGFAVGYGDSYSGRNFRAIQLVQQPNAHTGEPEVRPDRSFDRAFLLGYEAGQRQGLHDGRSTSAVESSSAIDCASGAGIPAMGEACEAYQRGYRLGYSDGFTNQREGREVFARK